jgi:predicted nucleotide-binding protein with TIR-like domain
MNKAAIVFAKLAGLYKEIVNRLNHLSVRSRLPNNFIEYYERYDVLRDELLSLLPELYSDLPQRDWPSSGSDYSFSRGQFKPLLRDLEYIFEVRANSELAVTLGTGQVSNNPPERVFISHGRSQDWREVQDFIEKDLKVRTLELSQAPNKGRTVLQKLNEESNACSFAVVVMTGDDDIGTGAPRARENVMHEIGFFQGKYGLANVCLLHEEGTNIPSNIHGLVYIPFPKGLVSATFGVLRRELLAVFSVNS